MLLPFGLTLRAYAAVPAAAPANACLVRGRRPGLAAALCTWYMMWSAWLFVAAAATVSLDLLEGDKKVCKPITVELCQDIGYNMTSMPNLIGHETQADVDDMVTNFGPLIQVGCSSQLKFFLCSTHVPMCTDKVDQLIGPCASLCESVRRQCGPLLDQFGFKWPPYLACENFPEENDGRTMCMEGNKEPEPPPRLCAEGVDPALCGGPFPSEHPTVPTTPSNLNQHNVPMSSQRHCSDKRDWSSYVWLEEARQCAAVCAENSSILFGVGQKQVASIWLGCLAGLCLILCCMSLIGCAVSSHRLRYPEKPLMFINVCYALACVGYMIRLFFGRTSTACSRVDLAEGSFYVLVADGIANHKCTIVFIFLYYFFTASMLWWLALTLTWFLAVGLGWSRDQIERRPTIFHLPVWGIPALLTVVVLVRQTVEADELTALCGVGHKRTDELLRFVILPQVICLVLGLALLTVGFLSALCSCHAKGAGRLSTGTTGSGSGSVRSVWTKTSGTVGSGLALDGAMMKLGALAVVYVVPSSCLLVAHFYEYTYRADWLLRPKNGAATGATPSFQLFVVKIVASLFYGLVCAGWLLMHTLCATWNRNRFPQHKSRLATTDLAGYPPQRPLVPHGTPMSYSDPLDSRMNGAYHSVHNDQYLA